MRPSETLHSPSSEPLDDTTNVIDNGGYVHLREATEDEELYFENGEDADGNPTHPANVNSRAYNPELDDRDEPLVDGTGLIQQTRLDQIADLPPDSERPESER